MNELSPQAQSIVDAARADDGPTDADYARNRRATMARVGLGLGAIGAGASTATSAGAATVSVSGAGVASSSSAATVLALKAIATLAVIGAAGLGTARLHATTSERSALVSVSASVSNPPSLPRAMPQPLPSEGAAALQWAVESQKAGAPLVDDHHDAPPRTRVAKPSSTFVEGSLSTLAAETALLGATNEALADSKPERALALLDEYVARFPHGTLEEEHAATRAIALCEANRAVEGKDAAALFLRAHPKSPLTARVRFACEN